MQKAVAKIPFCIFLCPTRGGKGRVCFRSVRPILVQAGDPGEDRMGRIWSVEWRDGRGLDYSGVPAISDYRSGIIRIMRIMRFPIRGGMAGWSGSKNFGTTVRRKRVGRVGGKMSCEKGRVCCRLLHIRHPRIRMDRQ